MRAKRIPQDEQLKLITECRQSGLSDYQWCRMHDIQPGIFYNWISRFRKRSVTIPESCDTGTVNSCAMQEVVKLELLPEQETVPANAEYNACILANKTTTDSPAFEIQTSNATIRFYNEAEPCLIETVMNCLMGGVLHAG